LGVKEARELMLVEYLMGHKIPALEQAYPGVDFKDPDVVRGFYQQIEPHLIGNLRRQFLKPKLKAK